MIERGAGSDATDSSVPATLRRSVQQYLTGEIEVGSFPGAVYAVGNSAGVIASGALGNAVLKPARIKATPGTIYDVASLTKPLITATLALGMVADQAIHLDQKVSEVLTELRGTDKEPLTFTDLLTHRSGFQAWYPLYAEGLGDEAYLAALVRRPLRYLPGSHELYSCLGFILLKLALERVAGTSAKTLAQRRILDPLGLTSSLFSPPPGMKYEIAATEWGNASERKMVAERRLSFSNFRNYMIWGEVNDGNAWYIGGMGGNAGLFSTALDVFAMAKAWLTADERLLPKELFEIATRNYTVGLDENRGLGWQLASSRPNGPTSMLSDRAYGHTGFSGTSVWIDPERDLIMVLLTNRIHPSVKPFNMQKVRRQFHLKIVEEWDRMR